MTKMVDSTGATVALDELNAMIAAKEEQRKGKMGAPSDPAPDIDLAAIAKAGGTEGKRRRRARPLSKEIAAEQDPNFDEKKRFGKGNKANPWGRSGKDGKSGFSFKTGFIAFFSRLTADEQMMMWQALAQKAANGDVQAMKLLLQFNQEMDQPKLEVEADTGVRISLTMPPMES